MRGRCYILSIRAVQFSAKSAIACPVPLLCAMVRLFHFIFANVSNLTVATCSELAKDAEYNRMKETTLNLITAGPAPKGYILSTSWLNRTFFSAGAPCALRLL